MRPLIPTLALTLLATAAAAAEPLPLRHGTYVLAGTPCADPPFAALTVYDGVGLTGAHSRQCRLRTLAHRGRTYTAASTCDDDPTPARYTYRIDSPTRFTETSPFHAPILTYRLCPAAALPASLRRRHDR